MSYPGMRTQHLVKMGTLIPTHLNPDEESLNPVETSLGLLLWPLDSEGWLDEVIVPLGIWVSELVVVELHKPSESHD